MIQKFHDNDTRNLKWYIFPPRELPEKFLDMDIAGLGLSNRAVQALREKEINCVMDVLDYSMKSLSETPGVGYANAHKIASRIDTVFRKYRDDLDCSRVPFEVAHRILVKNYSPLRAFRMHYKISLDHLSLKTKVSRDLLEKYDEGTKFLKNARIAAIMGLGDRSWQLDDMVFRRRWNITHIPAAINEVFANNVPIKEAAEKHLIDKKFLVDFKLLISPHWSIKLPELSGEQLAAKVDDLGLQHKTNKLLSDAGIYNLAGIVIRAESQLLSNRSFGRKSLADIWSAIAKLNK